MSLFMLWDEVCNGKTKQFELGQEIKMNWNPYRRRYNDDDDDGMEDRVRYVEEYEEKRDDDEEEVGVVKETISNSDGHETVNRSREFFRESHTFNAFLPW